MAMGRPKALIKRDVQVNLKLTKFEAEKIARIAEKKNITRTEAILRGIDLLERDKPKKYKNISGSNKKNSTANIAEEVSYF